MLVDQRLWQRRQGSDWRGTPPSSDLRLWRDQGRLRAAYRGFCSGVRPERREPEDRPGLWSHRRANCHLGGIIRDANAGRVTEIGCTPDFPFHYVYVDDVADAIVTALDAKTIPSPAYNVGGGLALPMPEIAAIARRTIPNADLSKGRTTSPMSRPPSTCRGSGTSSDGRRRGTSRAASPPMRRP